MKVIKANVTATKIEFNNGLQWNVEGKEYASGYVVKSTSGEMVNASEAPIGFVITGDLVEYTHNRFDSNWNSLGTYTEIAFQAHDNIITDKQNMEWLKARWIKFAGNDKHFYRDVESITYRDPKTNKIRTDKVYTISIQRAVNVIVWRKNGRYPTTAIPIKNVIERHLKTF